MDAVTFTSLAPRIGSRPMMSGWSDIGTSAMSGGAFSWGNVWSGLKNFGSKAKNYGSKIWNSSTGQKLRDKLKQTNFQDKVVEGLATGIHGAIDLARQKLDKELDKRLERPIEVEEEDIQGEPDAPLLTEKEKEELVAASKQKPLAPPPLVVSPVKKRPREEDLVMTLDEPPSYDEIFGDKAGAPTTYPMTRPVHPLARPVLPSRTPVAVEPPPAYEPPTPAPAPVVVTPKPAVVAAAQPARPRAPTRGSWQNTLSSITGLGVRSIKRRRCWY
ncbi:pVI [Bat mastadenovirus]|nr:pVI [Bat mastadenovirus]